MAREKTKTTQPLNDPTSWLGTSRKGVGNPTGTESAQLGRIGTDRATRFSLRPARSTDGSSCGLRLKDTLPMKC